MEGAKIRSLEGVLALDGISEVNKQLIRLVFERVNKRGRVKSESTRLQYLHVMRLLGEFLGEKPFTKATRADIDAFLDYLKDKRENKRGGTGLDNNTLVGYIAKLRVTYQLLFGMKKRKYPVCVEDIEYTMTKKRIEKSALLTPEEVNRIVDAATNYRDKALVKLLWDSAIRAGEAASLRIRDIAIDDKGFTGEVSVRDIAGCKSGTRCVPIVECVPEIKAWLNIHPDRKNPDAPLWVKRRLNNGEPIRADHILRLIKKIARRAKIEKNVYPHLLRHSRATFLKEKGMDEFELRRFMGHKDGSAMTSTYVHLASSDIKKCFLKTVGFKTEEQARVIPKKGDVCFRCGYENILGSRFCNECGSQIVNFDDLHKKLDVLERLEKIAPVLEGLMENKHFNKALEEMKGKRLIDGVKGNN